jgi:hypothetical protein
MSIRGANSDVKQKMKIFLSRRAREGPSPLRLALRLCIAFSQDNILRWDENFGLRRLSLFATTAAAASRFAGPPRSDHPPDQVQRRPGDKNNGNGHLPIHFRLVIQTNNDPT